MITAGADASSVVSSNEMRAMGLQFCVRYFSQYPSKNMTRGEVEDFSKNGFDLVAVYEDDKTDWTRGLTGGEDNARRALSQASAVGMPISRPFYFAVDMDVDPNDSRLHAYFQGISNVLGAQRRGAYASTGVLRALKSENLIDFTWRTMSWAWNGGPGDAGEFSLVQTRGINDKFDADSANSTDFGQWRLNWTPVMVKPEPLLHLWIVQMCARQDPNRPPNQTTNGETVAPIQEALLKEGFLKPNSYTVGHYGKETISAYAGWQGKCGYRGKDADGIPGMGTLSKLGSIHGFHVVS